MTELRAPTFADVLHARRTVERYLHRTPLLHWPLLDETLGCEVLVKHENHQPIGAFKVRGGVYLVSRLAEDERKRGVISASTGNHGQSLAWAAQRFGVRAVIVVPQGANSAKVASMRALGADVRFHGRDFDDAREHVERAAVEEGFRYIHSANEPDLIAGVATWTLEVIEEAPDVDAVFVPIGGGSGAAGCTLVASTIRPDLAVVGVQAAAAPAAFLSWKEGRITEAPSATFAEGVATRTGFELPQRMFRDKLQDFVLVEEEEIRKAMRLILETTRNVAEGAGALGVAAILKDRARWEGKKVAVVLSGGNVTVEGLREVLT